MKKFIALCLAVLTVLSLMACGNTGAAETQPKAEKDDGVLRVLMIGHSLGNDVMWMQPSVFMNEAPDMKVVIGFLYYSGCPLAKHVEHAKLNMPVYGYLEFDSQEDTFWRIAQTDGKMRPYVYGKSVSGQSPESGISQTIQYAVQRQDWDIVVTQGYPWEAAKVRSTAYDPKLVENFKTLNQYVLEHDIDKETTPKFGWNMVWCFPNDDMLIRYTDKQMLDSNFKTYEEYYDVTAEIVRDELVPGCGIDYVFPSSTAFINALSGYKVTQEMYRDYAHASDFGRILSACLWYCTLTGTDIKDCKFAPINYQFQRDEEMFQRQEDLVITDEDKAVIIEVLTNAMKNPYVITPKA